MMSIAEIVVIGAVVGFIAVLVLEAFDHLGPVGDELPFVEVVWRAAECFADEVRRILRRFR